jgi:hypothetical protein
MAVLKLKLDEPVKAMLKYATGKFKAEGSRWQGSEPTLMFTLTGGDIPAVCNAPEAILSLPLDADQMFSDCGVRKGTLFSICKRKTQQGAEYHEVRKVGGPQEPPSVPQGASARANYSNGHDMTAVLEASIQHAKIAKQPDAFEALPTEYAQRVNPSGVTPAAQPGPTLVSAEQPKDTAVDTIRHTGLSQLFAGAGIAVIDAYIAMRDYAISKDLDLVDIKNKGINLQDLISTAVIHTQRMAELECKFMEKAAVAMNRVQNNGGVQWRQ